MLQYITRISVKMLLAFTTLQKLCHLLQARGLDPFPCENDFLCVRTVQKLFKNLRTVLDLFMMAFQEQFYLNCA